MAVIGLAAPGGAERLQQDRIVNPNPADFTPNIQNGTAYAVAQIGNKIFVGGSFTQVKEVGASTVITRNYILAFNASTGTIDNAFYPRLNGAVYDLLPASDGQSIYVAGQFSQLGGVLHKGLVRLNASTGALISDFKLPTPDGIVRNVEQANGKLYIGGTWSKLGGVSRPSLAALNPTTGALDPSFNFKFSGIHNGGTTLVYSFDIPPDSRRLVAIGNFDQVNGIKRHQFAVFDLTTNPATLANYYTPRFEPRCSLNIQTYMRDVQFSLDSSYFVIATTGAGYNGTLCDSVSRWETAKSGLNVQQTWVDYTGGDTLTQIGVTGPVLYVGGHQRWLNNTGCADTTCQGAVSRPGIAAISPENGLPFSWNPGKDRGHAVEDLVPTLDGLWVASDTAGIGGEWHSKIAKFPLSGGKVVPTWYTGSLPGNVYMGGQISPSQNTLKHRSFDGSISGSVVTDSTAGLDWTLVRGAFMINGQLYYGRTDGSFNRRSYNGVSLGTVKQINTADQLKFMTTWHGQVKTLPGLFYARGRLYYTRGDSALHYRYFNPESDIVGPDEFTAAGNLPGVSWSSVGGMFVDGSQLYFVNNSTGSLNRIAFTAGVPTGSATVVSSSDWRGRAVFLFQGPPNQPPVASFTSSCLDLTCGFDGTKSSDPDGSIASYAWNFGDGSSGTGPTPSHSYSTAGTYAVKLTVTDNRGSTSSVTHSVQVAQSGIGFRDTTGFNANSNTPQVTVPTGVQAGDGLLLVLTINTNIVTISGDPAGWQAVGTAASSGITSRAWRRVATAGDAGSAVTVGLSDYAKADLRLIAYDGTNTSNPVATAVSALDSVTTATHVSPTASVTQVGSWVVSYWADKGTTTAWTAPSGVVTRAKSYGTGTAHISALTADTGAGVEVGTYGGLSAVADLTSNKAVSWTIVLAP